MEAMARLLKDLSIDFTDMNGPLRQVIVNTHSPVLVNQLLQWKDNPEVSVCLSRLNTLVTDMDGTKNKIKITKMSPVLKEKENSVQLSLFSVSEPERRVTLAEVIDYLQTADTENTIKDIQSDE